MGGIQAAAEMENARREAVGGYFFQPEADPLSIGRIDDAVTFCITNMASAVLLIRGRAGLQWVVWLFYFSRGGGTCVEGSCVSTWIIRASVSLPDGDSVR